MRILMWLTLGMAGATGLCAYGLVRLPIWAGILLGLPAFLLGREKKLRIPALVLAGAALGLTWFSLFSALRLEPVRAMEGQTGSLTVQITAPESESWAEGCVKLDGRLYPVRVALGGETGVQPGELLKGSFTLKGILDRERDPWYVERSRGIFLEVHPQGQVQRFAQKGNILSLPGRLRLGILDRIRKIFPEDLASFAGALLLGEDRGLDPALDWSLRTAGIRHIIAVSGLHVSILFGALAVLTGRREKLTFALGIPVLLLFCAITGFSPSVVRAAGMLWLMSLADLLRQQNDPLTSLSFAVLTMLLLNPMVITSVSFQLSAACLLGIGLSYMPFYVFLIEPFLAKKYYRVGKWLCSSAAVSFSALIFVIPLSALYFGSVSLVSPLTNLLTVWAVSWIFWGILLVLGISLIHVGAAAAAGKLVSLMIRYVLGVTGILGRLPVSAVYTRSAPVALWLLAAYFLVFLLFRHGERHFRAFGAMTAAGLVIALSLSWGLPRLDRLRVSVLDLNRGQAVLVRDQGRSVLALSGENRMQRDLDRVAQELLSQGIFRLDELILTSGNREDGEALTARVPADRICLPSGRQEQTLGHSRITLWGEEKGRAVLFDTENYDILITDGPVPESLGDAKPDCVAAAWTGRRESVDPQVLKKLDPDLLILSPGRSEIPRALLMELSRLQLPLVRTAEQGTILIRR